MLLLAGCGGSTPLSPSLAGPSTALRAPTAERMHPSYTYTYNVLYNFKGAPGDGAYPYTALINVKGTLYSTTQGGGANSEGTVFSIKAGRTEETMLHSFGGSGDGAYPFAGLINVDGTLYGTTETGGVNNDGTVFSITPSGTETVLHSFGGSGDGVYPCAGLINVKGTLYSTTDEGGSNNEGTVFSITPSGTETVLHSFGRSGDGTYPFVADLLDVKGKLYGTTPSGGADGDGTLFSITPSGKEKVLYSFKGGSGDGASPYGNVINVNGTFYGMTYAGGSGSCTSNYSSGCGTVFSTTRSGKETMLYSFKGSGDGGYPEAGLINAKSTLYGTTDFGGAENVGTVFSITPSGTETVLHSFATSGDGEHPSDDLLNVKGWLYGTAYSGGSNDYGAIFRQKP
jgi:uncharacterized repeat protein (TIGR03803 family)